MRAAVSSCRLLSAPPSAGCVAPVSSAAQYGIMQYLQPGIITRLRSTRAASPRTLALLITCHMFGFGLTLIFKTGEETICSASERLERRNRGLRCGKRTVGKQQLCRKRVFHNLDGAGAGEQHGSRSWFWSCGQSFTSVVAAAAVKRGKMLIAIT